MTVAQSTALAIVRCGRSFDEAAQSSGLTVDQVVNLWRRVTRKRRR